MIVLGLILLVGAVVVAVSVISAGGDPVHLHLHWFTIRTNGGAVFVVGAATLAVALLGFWILRAGMRRTRRRRREIKELRQRAGTRHERQADPAPAPASPPARPAQAGPEEDDDHFSTAPRD
jgi:hypothetical protein